MLFTDDDPGVSDKGFFKRIKSEVKSFLFGSAVGRMLVEAFRLACGCFLVYMFLSWAAEIIVFIIKILKMIIEQGL